MGAVLRSGCDHSLSGLAKAEFCVFGKRDDIALVELFW